MADAPHLRLLATRSCRWRHRTFLSQVVTSAFEMFSSESFGFTPFYKSILRRVAVELRQTPPFHTFFLPKRERKYQRKRFRAAAKTPRGHRGCSALSALEMRRRLQRCNCSSQNEALAPLIGRKTYVFGCSHDIPPKTPEGT